MENHKAPVRIKKIYVVQQKKEGIPYSFVREPGHVIPLPIPAVFSEEEVVGYVYGVVVRRILRHLPDQLRDSLEFSSGNDDLVNIDHGDVAEVIHVPAKVEGLSPYISIVVYYAEAKLLPVEAIVLRHIFVQDMAEIPLLKV